MPTGFAKRHGFLGIDQHLVIWSRRPGAPREFAIGDVVGREVSAHAEFGAGDADDDLVFDNERSACAGLAFLWITVDRLPQFLAALGVESNEGGVCLIQEDLAVSDTARRD